MNTIKLSSENKPLMIAHRGCSGLERENTAAAFVAAGNRSYWGIETDVHKTLDGKYVIFHDNTTLRLADEDLEVERTSFDTLRALKLKNKYTDEKDRADLVIPTLSEYIAICKHYEKIAVLELKNEFTESEIGEICDIIADLDYLNNTTFISFCYQNLVYLRRKHPAQSAQFLLGSSKKPNYGIPENWLEMLLAGPFDLDIMHSALTPEIANACHQNGIKINTWTVNTPEDAARVIELGVDQITTNILE